MNIFVLDKNPQVAARYHADKHVVKMILESTQMLATAYYTTNGIKKWKEVQEDPDKTLQMAEVFAGFPRKSGDERGSLPELFWIRGINPYRPCFVHHPCTVWVGENLNNWMWLHSLATELCTEFTHRYGKVHACQKVLEWMARTYPALSESSTGEVTPFATAMPQEYAPEDSLRTTERVVESYRDYYVGEKSRMFYWKNRQVPQFVIERMENEE